MEVGDRVMCMSTPEIFPDEKEWGCVGPVKGNMYTIREILHGGSGVYLEEIINPVNRYYGGVSVDNAAHRGEAIVGEPAWSVRHFWVIDTNK